jgi:hypothetical protein
VLFHKCVWRPGCRYTIFINIAVQGSSDQAWHIAQGPLSLVFGVMLGAAAALGCAATRVWKNRYKRIIVVFVVGTLITWHQCSCSVQASTPR